MSQKTDPLDLVKAKPPRPERTRQGSITYHHAPAHTMVPERSRRSLRKAVRQEVIVIDDPKPFDPINDVTRTADGTLTHPAGKRRRD